LSKGSDLEERLEKLEYLLKDILSRLERLELVLEKMNPSISEVLKFTGEIIALFSSPPIIALEAAGKILNIMKRYGKLDDISKAIIEVLSVKGEANISELTREVKAIRGKASRRIIAERVRMLSNMGIVSLEKRGNRIIVKLNVDIE